MSEYYDGTKLLSLKDINGKKPEIYICTGNRTAGKTTYFNRFMVNGWLKRKEKFCLLYRFNYELANCAERFLAHGTVHDIAHCINARYHIGPSSPLTSG